MEKQKRWQFYLIVAVLVLTLYNILPTIFYYTKPLDAPIDAKRAEVVAVDAVNRVNELEQDSKDWLTSFSNLLGIKPASIELNTNNSGLIALTFKSSEDANLFKRFLPKAGLLIPFVPAQLELVPESGAPDLNAETVLVQRNISVHLDPSEVNDLFIFTKKTDGQDQISDLYKKIIDDRVAQVAIAIGGPSKTALQMAAAVRQQNDPRSDELVIAVAKELVDVDNVFGKNSPITKRYEASFSQIDAKEGDGLLQKFVAKMESVNKKAVEQSDLIKKEKEAAKEKGESIDPSKEQSLAVLSNQIKALETAISMMKKSSANFKQGAKPLTIEAIQELIASAPINEGYQEIDLTGYNPFIQSLLINWESSQLVLKPYEDIQKLRLTEGKSEKEIFTSEKANQFIINDIARIARYSDEAFIPSDQSFAAKLNQLNNSQSFLAMDLGYVAQKRAEQIKDQLLLAWEPAHSDLVGEAYPVRTYREQKELKSEEQKLGLVVYSPASYNEIPPAGFRSSSIYVIAKGLDTIIQKYKESPDAPESKLFLDDFTQLYQLMQTMGFIGYPAVAFDMPKEFSKDYIFELSDYYGPLLKATRENFVVKGSKRYAVLDFSNVEQRIITLNKIGDRTQEELLKWQEAYQAAQVDLNITNRYTVPAPTKSPFWQNLKLSAIKYFRGDDRKILKWGLDLSGGKTVRLGLVDQNNRPVTDPNDLKQAVNELYARINKMGVAERTIRIEDSNILLDFPGSQNLSASELVKASAMYFHIVNEKFTPMNSALASSVNQFLQEVWNEAVVTNRKDIESINEIAWQHLGGDSTTPDGMRPRSESAALLYGNGLRLGNPFDKSISSQFNDTLSSVAIFRATDAADWDEQTNPLLIVFHNYALEGSSLENVQAGYDSSEGNTLMFGIKSSYDSAHGSGSPRDDFYSWTSQFAEDKISGTPKETYSRGRGWRMAVILNGSIVTAPALNSALRDSARITGRFSQREVTQLATDLKAGSLSFTPRILSEENISPELGLEERTKGLVSSFIALVLVVVAMVGYYHFAGIVASCAVLLNIFIMWGVLQNLGAALTLPGIAGIVLTIGMAVDANVLVFERIREEFKISGRIGSAIQAGYRKAFSAIVDSNITTLIAAIILIQFDSGPIKGFAVTLIIGIISSMFTSLFMTRYFFAGWIKNPQNKTLTMSQFLGKTNFNFLAQTKKAVVISVIVMVIGSFFLMTERKTIFGMDFTGGYSLNVELEERPDHPNYRLEVAEALLSQGASRSDFEVRELSRSTQLRIHLGTSMNESGHPFYQMPETNSEGKYAFDYEKDPRLNWVVTTLQKANLEIAQAELAGLQNHWTVMTGQFSEAMRNNATYALVLALVAILIYITFRFEFKYAIGAVIGLTHDVFITLGILAIFHAMGFALQIDLQVIGAIMTIIGYSLNDTIIVFDRIREDLHIMRKMSFREVINHALNVTLSRTIMTSGTTLLVLLTLVLFGGQSIFSFSFVMTVGVIVGTLSSLFVAAPAMLYFHQKELPSASQPRKSAG